MSDESFPVFPDQEASPPRFEDAVRVAIARLEERIGEFEALAADVPEDEYTPEEWAVIETAAGDVELSTEMAEEGYIAVAFDSHAWYRIMEHLERVNNRLDSALGIIRMVRDRRASR